MRWIKIFVVLVTVIVAFSLYSEKIREDVSIWGDVLPDSSGRRDIGANTLRWRQIYVDSLWASIWSGNFLRADSITAGKGRFDTLLTDTLDVDGMRTDRFRSDVIYTDSILGFHSPTVGKMYLSKITTEDVFGGGFNPFYLFVSDIEIKDSTNIRGVATDTALLSGDIKLNGSITFDRNDAGNYVFIDDDDIWISSGGDIIQRTGAGGYKQGEVDTLYTQIREAQIILDAGGTASNDTIDQYLEVGSKSLVRPYMITAKRFYIRDNDNNNIDTLFRIKDTLAARIDTLMMGVDSIVDGVRLYSFSSMIDTSYSYKFKDNGRHYISRWIYPSDYTFITSGNADVHGEIDSTGTWLVATSSSSWWGSDIDLFCKSNTDNGFGDTLKWLVYDNPDSFLQVRYKMSSMNTLDVCCSLMILSETGDTFMDLTALPNDTSLCVFVAGTTETRPHAFVRDKAVRFFIFKTHVSNSYGKFFLRDVNVIIDPRRHKGGIPYEY